jgi:carboxymethylenebutenolidase
MGHAIELHTAQGTIGGWRADPDGRPRGGIVVIQEIFGVNAHIRSVVERFASYGYATLAPALFDPVERDVELDYDQAGIARGVELVGKIGFDLALECVHAAAKALHGSSRSGSQHPDARVLAGDSQIEKVAAIGYCWGGSVAFLANTRLALPAVSYYGARTVPFLGERCEAPMLFHFGAMDGSIPPEAIEKHRAAQPQAEFHVWPAGHGFNCDQRKDYDADSATNALAVTLGFFERVLT